jgi:hypothetical protein
MEAVGARRTMKMFDFKLYCIFVDIQIVDQKYRHNLT